MRDVIMRGGLVIGLLAVAGCAVNEGRNPNYLTGGNSAYDKYRQQREIALKSGTDPQRIVPIVLPVNAPTASQIAGMDREVKAVATAPAVMPVTTTGSYAGTTPVLVQYAVATTHAPGTVVWPRTGASTTVAARICATFATADRAQIAFLAAGGPQTDSRGMDPDGDGYVCGWNPAPFRTNAL